MAAPSLTRRVLASMLVALLAFFGVAALALDAMFRDLAQRSLRELLDAQLLALIAAAETDDSGRVVAVKALADPRFQTPESGLYAEVRSLADARGARPALVWRSPSLTGVGVRFAGAAGEEPAFRYLEIPRAARLASLERRIRWQVGEGVTEPLVFSVATSLAPYEAQLRAFRTQLFGGLAVLAVGLLLVVAWLLRRALAPLARLQREIGAVETGQLEVLGEDYPRELAGVASSLNTLLASERARIERYRATLGDLAHSLKTPLAVMRGALEGDSQLDRGDSTLAAQVGRMSEIVDRTLRQAAAAGGQALGRTPVPILPVAAELRAALLRVHARRDLALEVAIDERLRFFGERADLLEALGNLIDNACKWCRSRVRVTAVPVAPSQDGRGAIEVRVEDDGPGWPAEWVDRQPVRGRRADERIPGHGIGLAMAADMARLYGGRLELRDSALGGALVCMVLPGDVG